MAACRFRELSLTPRFSEVPSGTNPWENRFSGLSRPGNETAKAVRNRCSSLTTRLKQVSMRASERETAAASPEFSTYRRDFRICGGGNR
jgi:hypothetical protein